MISEILPIILVAFTGYMIFYYIGFPTPAIMGSFVATILFLLLTGTLVSVDGGFTTILQAMLGVHIGILMHRQVFKEMKTLMYSSVLMVGWTLLMTFGMGLILVKYFHVDIATALLSTAPAGVSETGMLAVTVQADVGMVTVFQISRMLITVTLIPLFIRRTRGAGVSKMRSQTGIRCVNDVKRIGKEWMKHNLFITGASILPVSFTLMIGGVGAVLGQWLNIPAGALMGSFILVAVCSLSGISLRRPPNFIRIMMQVGIGMTLGINAMMSRFADLQAVLLPVIVFTVIIFLTAYLNYLILKALNGWSDLTCLLAAAPAGMTPMSMLAYEYSDNPLEVSLLHMARLMTVKVVILPVIVIVLMRAGYT